jgi:hypothetical protein
MCSKIQIALTAWKTHNVAYIWKTYTNGFKHYTIWWSDSFNWSVILYLLIQASLTPSLLYEMGGMDVGRVVQGKEEP